MKRIIVIAIIALCVWLMATYPHTMLSPGELVVGHQDLNNKCQACHQPFWGISSEKCISCHKLSEIGKDSSGNKEPYLFHNNLAGQECSSCHTDHKGIKPGVSLTKFTHGFLSADEQTKCVKCHNQPSNDLHLQLTTQCSNCHNTIGWKSNVAFNHEMIQGTDKNNCSSCHQKPKDSYHGSVKNNCSACHSIEKWVPSSFDHSAYFRLDQNHNAKCNTCHSDNNFSKYTCYGCHEHSESNIRDEHNEEGISNFSNCTSCHRSGNEHEIEYRGEKNGKIDQKDVNDVKKYINSEKEGKKSHKKEEDDDD